MHFEITKPERKSKRQSTAARVGPKPKQGPPSFASAQALRVLDIQREHPEGVSREKYLTPVHLGGYGITQVGARVNELEYLGYIFEHRREAGEKFTTYILRSEPLEPRKSAPGPLVRKPQASASMSASVEVAAAVPEQIGMFGTFMAYETGRMDRGRR